MDTSLIDLRSDTLTRPGPRMLRAMAAADYGDDCYGENTSVRELEEHCMEVFGKQAAVFMPTGTMSNQVALKSLVGRGQEVLCDSDYHINFFEASPSSDLGGAAINSVRTPDGFLTPGIAEDALGRRARWSPVYAETRLVWMENTINGRGGRVYPLPLMQSVRAWCFQRDISVFLDGARILNAAVATGIAPRMWGQTNDAMSLCFAKGLGAPMGSVLMGTAEFISMARHYRKWYGGALHQSGPIAAAALWAVQYNVERLAEDHLNARMFASVLAESSLFVVDQPETNIVIFDVGQLNCSPDQYVQLAAEAGVKVLVWRHSEIRAVFSLTVSGSDALVAARRLVRVAETAGRRRQPELASSAVG
ncbi:threonine aldolase family protein [Amycolatopsis anabasis]|uniref:threonine aldolase family protein n=1 Tax=Amycolatopsis anabasis TaxID=1840409 RepID=UPI001C551546|nr:GntG family PLP-dependent aldolase [Amycolatopsis anabasis]